MNEEKRRGTEDTRMVGSKDPGVSILGISVICSVQTFSIA